MDTEFKKNFGANSVSLRTLSKKELECHPQSTKLLSKKRKGLMQNDYLNRLQGHTNRWLVVHYWFRISSSYFSALLKSSAFVSKYYLNEIAGDSRIVGEKKKCEKALKIHPQI